MARRKIPLGYLPLREAFDRFGRHLFPEAWNGKEIWPDISKQKGDLRNIVFGLRGPAPRPPSNTESGQRRDQAEDQFRQIMYSGDLQAFLFSTLTGKLSEIPPTRWLADAFVASIEDSRGEWLDLPSTVVTIGTILISCEELIKFLEKSKPADPKVKSQGRVSTARAEAKSVTRNKHSDWIETAKTIAQEDTCPMFRGRPNVSEVARRVRKRCSAPEDSETIRRLLNNCRSEWM